MSQAETKLRANQERAIQALLSAPNITDAAKAAGVGRATINRWLQETEFADAYKAARASMLENTMYALQSASGDAVTCLRAIVNDQTALITARVSAARGLLEFSLKSREVLETEARLSELEGRLNAQSTTGRKTA